MLVEYLYIDRRRLANYFEQFRPGPFYDKVRNWKVALGMTGPTAEGSQTRAARPYTEHERVVSLLKKVRPKGLDSAFDFETEPGLFTATIPSRRIALPKDVSKRADYPGLAMWITPPSGKLPFIALIEDYRDYRGNDDNHVDRWSGHSTLALLFAEFGDARPLLDLGTDGRKPRRQTFNIPCEADEIEHHVAKPLLIEALRRSGVREADSCELARISNKPAQLVFELHVGQRRFDATVGKPPGFRRGSVVPVSLEEDMAAELACRFVEDTFDLVREWGGEIGPERQVDTIFRLRHTLIEQDARQGTWAIIGYPIIVAQHPSKLWT